MSMWISRRHFAAFAVLLALVLASMAPARQDGIDTGVLRRMNTMITAKAALTVLGNMTNGRMVFDRVQARTARRDLIAAIRDIPRRFRKPHSDPATRARPEIWIRQKEFSNKSTRARRAARAIRVNSLATLQSTLPRMLLACLACHREFRTPGG